MLLAAPKQDINVGLDLTFVVVLVLFVALTLFEERERRIDGAKLLARKMDEKSAAALTKYEDTMAKARETANAERDKIRAEGLKREKEILGEVRAATAQAIENGKRAVHEDAAKARATLKTESAAMA